MGHARRYCPCYLLCDHKGDRGLPLHGAGASVHHVTLQEDAVSKKLRVTANESLVSQQNLYCNARGNACIPSPYLMT